MMKRKPGLNCLARSLGFGLVVSVVTAYAEGEAAPTSVVTDKGDVQGFIKDGYRQFKGIPYAKPPVDALRWQPPAENDPWVGKREATRFANTCATNISLAGFGPTSVAEDCLYLNVDTPQVINPDKKLPVIVVIPGGGLRSGSGNEYTMTKLVNQDTIVVSLNYRLGIFGYFSHPALDTEGHPAINYGTMDQQAALRWVKKNIAHFGGDSNNVTLYGESAGGQAVLTQMVSPGAAGLFQKAIVSSGSYALDQLSVEQSRKFGVQLAQRVGCGDTRGAEAAACLRKLPTQTFLDNGIESIPGMAANADAATIDGEVLPVSFREAFSSGQYNKVPVISGSNYDEGSFFVGLMELQAGKPLNLVSFTEGLRGSFSEEKVEKMLQILKSEPSSANVGADYARLFGRAKFLCSAPQTSDLLIKQVPVYGYLFADRNSQTMIPPVSFPYGAAHINDLQYIFNDFHGTTGILKKLDQKQAELSSVMVSYFTNFAKTGNPNAEGLPTWDLYKSQDESIIMLEPGPGKVRMMTGMSKLFDCDVILRDL